MRQLPKHPDLWKIGLGGLVNPDRVVAIGRWDSMPVRRAARRANERDLLIDLRYGQACHWVLYMDSGHLVLISQDVPKGESDE